VAARCSVIHRYHVPGAPHQPGDIVTITQVVDEAGYASLVGKTGRVDHLSYVGCDQTYPHDPLICVEVGGTVEGFWREELGPA